MTSPAELHYRRAGEADFVHINDFLAPMVQQQQLLPRTDAELTKLLELAFVAMDGERVVGFCAVEIYSRKLAEIQGLAVATSHQRQGIGSRLVELCVELARKENVHELMAITASEGLFQECGFQYALPNQKRALFIHPAPREEG